MDISGKRSRYRGAECGRSAESGIPWLVLVKNRLLGEENAQPFSSVVNEAEFGEIFPSFRNDDSLRHFFDLGKLKSSIIARAGLCGLLRQTAQNGM